MAVLLMMIVAFGIPLQTTNSKQQTINEIFVGVLPAPGCCLTVLNWTAMLILYRSPLRVIVD
tara:strand:- start:239 stop:424 length:186 start_codon:yes stop_codon:yes gene_type:complete